MDHAHGRYVVQRPLDRFLRAASAVAVLAGGLLLGGAAQPAGAAPGESIPRYGTRIEVRVDGRMRVTETIVYDFGGERRHGIFRRIPVKLRYDKVRDRIYPIDDVKVTMDGSVVPFDQSWDGGYEELKIGDPDRTITGERTYAIEYTVRGALNSFRDHEEVYWNVVGSEWEVPIAAATATVTGPAAIQKVECFTGPRGSRLGCARKSVDGGSATFSHSRLRSGSGMSMVVAFPAGSVRNTGPILTDRHDLATAFQVSPATVGGAAGLGLVGVAAALVIGWLVGRDRRYVRQIPGLTPMPGDAASQRRKPLFGGPSIAVEFAPPDQVRPGQVGTLIDERAHTIDVTATIIDFAVRGHLRIVELPRAGTGEPQDWMLTKRTDGDPGFLPYERALFSALFAGRERVRLSRLKDTFAYALERVQSRLYTDMVDQGWYRHSPATTRNTARKVALGVVVASIVVTVLLAMYTHAALIGIGLVVGALVLLAVAGKFPARTARGSAMLARLRGFKLYLTTAEAERIKVEEREQIFSRYLPYAMVFGLAERWASIFRDIGTVRPNGTAGLYWYTGQPGWNMLYFNQSIGSFTTTTVGTIATTPSASGLSGFSDSGSSSGFSSGGGGGGGGGSW
jgi:uncharacterized membrane protein YgcG